MADVKETVTTEIVVDASKSKQGAEIFKQAVDAITASNQRLETSTGSTVKNVTALLDQYGNALKKVMTGVSAPATNPALTKAAEDANKVTVATQRMITSLSSQERLIDRIGKAFDPYGASVRKASADLEKFNQIAAGGSDISKRAAQIDLKVNPNILDAIGQNIVRQLQESGTVGGQLLGDAIVRSGESAGQRLGKTIEVALHDVTSRAPGTIDIAKSYTIGGASIESIGEDIRGKVQAAQKSIGMDTTLPQGIGRGTVAQNPYGELTTGAVQAEAAIKKLTVTDKDNELGLDKLTIAALRAQTALSKSVGDTAKIVAPKDDVATVERLGKSLDPTIAKLSEAKAKLQDTRVAFQELNRIATGQGPGAAQAVDLLAVAQKRLKEAEDETTKATNDNKFGILETANAHNRLSIQAQSAFHAVRGFSEQVAFGIPITRALTSELNNITFAMSGQGGLRGALGEVLGIFGKFLGVAVVLGAVGTAAYILGSRVQTVNANMRAFQTQLDTVGKGGSATAGSLQKLVDQLEDAGFKADAAKKAIEGLLKLGPQGLVTSAQNIGDISRLGLNISAQTGANPEDEAIALGKALTDGGDALRRYVDDRGLFIQQSAKVGEVLSDEVIAQNKAKQALLEQVIAQTQAGDKNRAAIIVIKALTDLFSGAYIKSLSETNKFTHELSVAWREFVENTSKTPVVAAVIDGLSYQIRATFKDIESFVKGIDKLVSGIGSVFTFVYDKLKQLGDLIPTIQIPEWMKNLVPTVTITQEPGRATNQFAPIGANAPQAAPTAPVTLGTGTPRLEIARGVVDTPDLNRLVTVLTEATKSLPDDLKAVVTSTERPGATVAGTGGPSQHGFGRALDYALVNIKTGEKVPGFMGRDVTGQFTEFDKKITEINQQMFPGTAILPGTGFRAQDSGHLQTAVGGTTTTTTSASAADQRVITDQTAKNTEVTKLNDIARADQIKGLQGLGVQQRLNQVFVEKYNEALGKGLPWWSAQTEAMKDVDTEFKVISLERERAIKIQDMETSGNIRTTESLDQGEGAGLRSLAIEKARIEQITQGGDVQQRANEELQKSATVAALAGRQQLAANEPVLVRQEALASAAIKGAAAEHEQSLENEAHARTYDALLKSTEAYKQAQISGTAADVARTKQLVELAQKEDDLALKQVRRADTAQQVTDLGRALQVNKDQAEVLAKEISLQGASTEEISKQIALLQLKQQLGERYNALSGQQKQDWIDSVTQVQNFNLALAAAQREQQRINDLVLNLADTISGTLTQAIENAFDSKKALNWGDALKGILKDITAQLANGLVIKPILGTAAGALGFGAVANQLGTVGGLGGLVTGNTGTGTAGTAGTSPGIGGNNITGALGLGGNAGFGGGTSTGGVVNFINTEIGPRLGFASQVEGAPFSATVQGPAAPGSLGIEPGLFGSSTLTGALGGIGTGLGAGGLVSSLLGGNSTAGSAVGAVGGLIGNIALPGIGGLIGGALGGLAGLFGNNRPSNNAAGADINLITGQTSRAVSSPDAASNQNVQTILQAVGSFAKQLQQSVGTPLGLPATQLAVQSGVRDGIKAGLGQEPQRKFGDTTEAINALELELIQSVTNFGGTVKTVVDKITDPAQIQEGIAFALQYDNLKKAEDSAFSSISVDTDKIGPFETAMIALRSQFDDLTNKANQFGLSLGPVNAGLNEATNRLRKDFKESLDQALDASSARDFITTLKAVSDAFVSNTKEQQAIGLGGDTEVTAKISQLEISKARETLITLTNKQLNDVYDSLKDTNPEIALLAKSISDAGGAADDTSKSLTSLTDGLKGVNDLLGSLRTGKLSGMTETQVTSSAINQYNRDLSVAKLAGPNVSGTQLATLSTSGEAAVNASLTAYGNAPQTADLRRQIIDDLEHITALANANVANAQTPENVQNAQTDLRSRVLAAAAEGSMNTPSGKILVGEKGPEWMLPKMSYASGTINTYWGGTTNNHMSYEGGTVAGPILVGERGPEWMKPKAGPGTGMGWMQVGKSGPEIIDQPGGAIILPFPKHPNDMVMGKYAEGTGGDYGSLPVPAANIASPDAAIDITGPRSGSFDGVVFELKALRKDNQTMRDELVAIKKQVQGGQVQAMTDARTGNSRLASIDTKLGAGLVNPTRRAVG